MQSVILSALVATWIDQLEDQIALLDHKWPAPHPAIRTVRRKTSSITANVIEYPFTEITPETRPELFEELYVEQPHPELDPLRDLLTQLENFKYNLDQLMPQPHPVGD